MKYKELMEISKKYPNCCKGSCSDGKCKTRRATPSSSTRTSSIKDIVNNK